MSKDTSRLIPLQAIDKHPRLQPRGGTSNTTIKAYAADMKKGDVFPPLHLAQIGRKLYIIDGHHRFEAALLAGREELPAFKQRYKSLDQAQLAALQSNLAHGKRMTNAEKKAAFTSYIENGLHLWGDDDFPHVPGTVKPYRRIAAQCPVYDFRTIGRKLKEFGIIAPRDDVAPFDPYRYEREDGPTEDDLAEEEAIILADFRIHIDAAAASYGLLGDETRVVALEVLRTLLQNLEEPKDRPALEI